METLKLDIVTPEGKIFSNDVKSVTLPGSEFYPDTLEL